MDESLNAWRKCFEDLQLPADLADPTYEDSFEKVQQDWTCDNCQIHNRFYRMECRGCQVAGTIVCKWAGCECRCVRSEFVVHLYDKHLLKITNAEDKNAFKCQWHDCQKNCSRLNHLESHIVVHFYLPVLLCKRCPPFFFLRDKEHYKDAIDKDHTNEVLRPRLVKHRVIRGLNLEQANSNEASNTTHTQIGTIYSPISPQNPKPYNVVTTVTTNSLLVDPPETGAFNLLPLNLSNVDTNSIDEESFLAESSKRKKQRLDDIQKRIELENSPNNLQRMLEDLNHDWSFGNANTELEQQLSQIDFVDIRDGDHGRAQKLRLNIFTKLKQMNKAGDP